MKKILFSLLALLALVSCSKEPGTTPTATDGRIRVVAGIDGAKGSAIPAAPTAAGASKGLSNVPTGPMDATTGLTGASFVIVESATTPTSFVGGTVYTGDVAATSGEVTFTSTPVPAYNPNDQNAWLAAYAPGGALTADAIEWTIDGKTDILATNTVWNAGKYTAPVTTGLNFNHLLARVQVTCQAEAGAALGAVQDAWGEITKIEFVDAPEKMKYDLSAAPTVSTSGSANFPLLKDYDGTAFARTAVPANGNTTVAAVAMLAPVAPTAVASFKLRITTSKPLTAEIPISLGGSQSPITAGYTHTVTLTFKADAREIEVFSTAIEPWGAGYTGGGDMEVPIFPSVGNYVYDDSSFSKKLQGGKTPVGIIFWVNPDDDKNFKAVSLDETMQQWSSEKVIIGATGTTNGAENMAVIKAIADWHDNYPAFAWCDDKRDGGSGWYLPALNELQYLYCASVDTEPVTWTDNDGPAFDQANRDAWDARFTASGVGGAKFTNTIYWSATEENSLQGNTWIMSFTDGYTDWDSKISNYMVRCVREYPLPPPPAVGDYYYSDGSFSTALEDGKTPVGVIFWVNPDDENNFKIVSLDEVEGKEWSTEDVTTGATGTANGAENMAVIKAIPDWHDKYPAFAWCADKTEGGSGWYLPANDELQYLYCASVATAPATWPERTLGPAVIQADRDTWDDRFTATGVGGAGFASYFYWSATECSSTYAWIVDFSNGYTSNYNKSSSYYVRCVREI